FFSINARIRARSIYEAKHRPAKLGGHLHKTKSFAVAFGFCLSEIAGQALFGVPSFLVPHYHYRLSVKTRHASYDGRVIAKVSIAVQFREVRKQQANEVERVWPLWMTR